MDGRQVQPDRWRPGRCAIARAAPEALTEGGPPRVSGRAVLPVHPAPRRSAPTPPRRCPARARTAPSTLSWRRPLVSPSPHSTVTKDTSALTERRAKPYRDVGGAGCGAAVRFGVKGAAALPGPSPRRRRCAAPRRPGGGAEADRRSPGSPRRVGGVTGATSSAGTRCGGPGLPIGTAPAVCASAWLVFRWCWARQPVRRLWRPDRVRQQRVGGPGRARWRSRCHPTTPARRHMKYEGFVKKCRHVRPFGTMAPVTTVSGGYDSARTWSLDE